MAVKGTRTTKPKPITTAEMEVAIAKYFGIRKHIIVPNLSWGFFRHECDLFIIRTSGYGIEVEIKRSRSDMLADFKKKRNHIDKGNRIVQLYYAFPKELLPKVEELVPEDCGIITVEKYNDRGFARMHREAKRRKGAKRLTEKEKLQIARLGTLRIWTLKEKLNLMLNKNDNKSKI